MNERIKQLAEQAITEKLSLEEFIEALKKEPNDFYGFRVSELEKFAELIVAETISVLQKRFMGDLNREDMEVRKCIEDVKNHFAVKE